MEESPLSDSLTVGPAGELCSKHPFYNKKNPFRGIGPRLELRDASVYFTSRPSRKVEAAIRAGSTRRRVK